MNFEAMFFGIYFFFFVFFFKGVVATEQVDAVLGDVSAHGTELSE